MVRCKMRCLERTELVGHDVATHTWKVRLVPVMPKIAGYPEGCEENRSFWNATPSGEVVLTYLGEPEVQVGAFYYIDLARMHEGHKEESPWKLWEVTLHERQIKVALSLSWADRPLRSGEARFDIQNVDAWPSFLGHVGTGWRVSVSPA